MYTVLFFEIQEFTWQKLRFYILNMLFNVGKSDFLHTLPLTRDYVARYTNVQNFCTFRECDFPDKCLYTEWYQVIVSVYIFSLFRYMYHGSLQAYVPYSNCLFAAIGQKLQHCR